MSDLTLGAKSTLLSAAALNHDDGVEGRAAGEDLEDLGSERR